MFHLDVLGCFCLPHWLEAGNQQREKRELEMGQKVLYDILILSLIRGVFVNPIPEWQVMPLALSCYFVNKIEIYLELVTDMH